MDTAYYIKKKINAYIDYKLLILRTNNIKPKFEKTRQKFLCKYLTWIDFFSFISLIKKIVMMS